MCLWVRWQKVCFDHAVVSLWFFIEIELSIQWEGSRIRTLVDYRKAGMGFRNEKLGCGSDIRTGFYFGSGVVSTDSGWIVMTPGI